MKNILKSIFTIFILLFTLTSCMQKEDRIVKEGDDVLVHYTGTFENWEKFDSSYDRWSPLEFVVWGWTMIEWFDEWVRWMKVWEKKTITIPPEKAYWVREEWKVDKIPRADLAHLEESGQKIEKGMMLWTAVGNFEILDVSDDYVTIDLNHQMAWKTLKFEIELVEIKK